ncbi:hypothetical protein OEA41_007203 [Lepraria neglecta]|uniref:Uncharacterized protein n=1 Tax=Lepraria neglecta TaxID=209136 RepID=A0AAD9ZCP1_9LECA|nr:hypothetical protein OEA41_007203 [Lepraria neglecta]
MRSQKRKSMIATPAQLRTPAATLTPAEDPAPSKRIKREKAESPIEPKDVKSKKAIIEYVDHETTYELETHTHS